MMTVRAYIMIMKEHRTFRNVIVPSSEKLICDTTVGVTSSEGLKQIMKSAREYLWMAVDENEKNGPKDQPIQHPAYNLDDHERYPKHRNK